MPSIHAIRTGSVRIHTAQKRRQGRGGLHRVLFDRSWTDWLPIYAWAIEHEEGVIVVDTGETSRSVKPGYFPRWHPYYGMAVEMDVKPEEEIGPQLQERGIEPSDVRTVVMTHLHTDHAGGLHHFPESEIRVEEREYESACGIGGRIQGYLPHRWPEWLDARPIEFDSGPFGSFDESCSITDRGDVIVVPTPGHTPSHVSVVVRTDEATIFLAGDTTYSEHLLLERHPDGVSRDPNITLDTIDRILRLASNEPLVYLPSHDPASEDRLKSLEHLEPVASAVDDAARPAYESGTVAR